MSTAVNGTNYTNKGNRFSNDAEGGLAGGRYAEPPVSIFLRPIAPPLALGLASYAGSTWIFATYLARWWGNPAQPSIFFPFLLFWGGLAQFITGFYGFHARDTLATIFFTLWGSFYLSLGTVIFLGLVYPTITALQVDSIFAHNTSFGAWFVVLLAFSWLLTFAALGRDFLLLVVLFFTSLASTLAAGGYYAGEHRTLHRATLKASAYFFILSAIVAWWRVGGYLISEAFGHEGSAGRIFSPFHTPWAANALRVSPGYGEPGVRNGHHGKY